MDRRHFLQGSAALGGSLLTAVDRSALAAPVRIDVPARCRGARKSISGLGSNTLKHKILACLLTLSAIAAAPAATSQTAPDYAAIVATPDRSDADRKLDTNRAPAQWAGVHRRETRHEHPRHLRGIRVMGWTPPDGIYVPR